MRCYGSLLIFNGQKIKEQDLLHGGFLPPKMGHERAARFIARVMNTNMDFHKTFHKGTRQMEDISERKHFFFAPPHIGVYMV